MKNKKIKIGKRYETSGLSENQHQLGSQGRVLKNLLGITKKDEIDKLEYQEQVRTLENLIKIFGMAHVFKEKDICRIHKIWLGQIYSWAGQYRQVNMTKDDFTFAASHAIPQLMHELEKGPLKEFTPCAFTKHEEIVHALAIVHTELVLIHPFREGNGRTIRLFLDLLVLSIGYKMIDWSPKLKNDYIKACIFGAIGNHKPMTNFILKRLKKANEN